MSTVDVVSLLSLLGSALDRRVLEALREAGFPGLRVSHGYVVQRLLVAARTTTELARELEVSQQAVSKLVAELVAAGYVARTTDPADRRRQPLILTEHGQQAVAATRQIRAALESELLTGTDPAEAEALRTTLLRALASIGAGAAVERRMVPLPP